LARCRVVQMGGLPAGEEQALAVGAEAYRVATGLPIFAGPLDGDRVANQLVRGRVPQLCGRGGRFIRGVRCINGDQDLAIGAIGHVTDYALAVAERHGLTGWLRRGSVPETYRGALLVVNGHGDLVAVGAKRHAAETVRLGPLQLPAGRGGRDFPATDVGAAGREHRLAALVGVNPVDEAAGWKDAAKRLARLGIPQPRLPAVIDQKDGFTVGAEGK